MIKLMMIFSISLFVISAAHGADLTDYNATAGSANTADIYVTAQDQLTCEKNLTAVASLTSQNKVVLSTTNCTQGAPGVWSASVRVLK